MPDPAEGPLISVRAGAAEPASMELPAGQAIGPLSFGRLGSWRIVAPGVLEEHGFLYFNGSALFLQSADPNSPVAVNGAPIPGDWTPIYAPCEIAFGGARLWFGVPAPAPRALSPRGLDDDDESTRMHPIEETAATRRSLKKDSPSATLKSPVTPPPAALATPQPAAPWLPSFGAPPPMSSSPVMGPGPLFGPPMPGAAPSFPGQGAMFPGPVGPPDAPPPRAPPRKESRAAAQWREASGPKKALMILMLPLLWAVWVIFTDKPPAVRPTKPASTTSSAPSTTPSAGAPSVPAPVTGAVTPPEPSASTKASGSASAAPASSAKTPQREAADAVAAGAFDKAARLYEELGRAHPEVPAYGEAARIMKARAGKR